MNRTNSSVDLTTLERHKANRGESFCSEPKRKKVRRSSLAWEGYKKKLEKDLGSKEHQVEQNKELCSKLSFSEVEFDPIIKEEKLDIRLQEVGILDLSSNKKVAIKVDEAKEKNHNNFNLFVDRYKENPLDSTSLEHMEGGNNNSGLRSSPKNNQDILNNSAFMKCSDVKDSDKTSMHKKVLDSSYIQKNDVTNSNSSQREVIDLAKCIEDYKDSFHEKKAYNASNLNLNFDYIKEAQTEKVQALEAKTDEEKNNFTLESKIISLERSAKLVEKQIKLKDEEILYLREEIQKEKSRNTERLKKISSLKGQNKTLKQDLSLMHEKYKSMHFNMENINQEESKKLVERANSLIEQMKSLYEEDKHTMKLKNDELSKESKSLKTELQGYKQIVKELVKRIRSDKSAIDLVYSIKKDLD